VLEVRDLEAYRGSSYVLQGVCIDVPDGACIGILGRNGMGKTTLIRALMGLSPASAGTAMFDGTPLTGRDPHAIARLGLGLVPQGRAIFPSLSVEENLTLAARAPRDGREGWTLERVYETFSNLAARRANAGSQLSGGEQQMLAIARALMTNPRLLLMDEPTEGLAPVMVDRVTEVIGALRDDRLSILLVEQNYQVAVEMSEHLYVLSKGAVVWDGLPRELEDAADVRGRELGV
jgi:branched-chain amino acid transport system ATP-binding protein